MKFAPTNRRIAISSIILRFSVLMGLTAVEFSRAAGPDDAPPPPPPPPRMNDTPGDLNLTDDQSEKLNALMDTMHQQEAKAREDFLKSAKGVLTPEQYGKLQASMSSHAPRPAHDHNQAASRPAPAASVDPATAPKGTVIFQGGYDTDPRDHGRPVVLVAAGLGVPTDVFRNAFSGVKPAGPGSEPEPAQVRLNKQALMKVLSPYGITNDRLDEVSNQYRYNHSKGEMWKNTPAVATATIVDGKITGIVLTNAGCGYTSTPTVVVAGYPDVTFTVTLQFSTDFATNGSIKSIVLNAGN